MYRIGQDIKRVLEGETGVKIQLRRGDKLKELKMIELANQRRVLTEITKTRKDLFKKLVNEVPVPRIRRRMMT